MPPDHLPDFMPGPGAMLFNSFEYLLVFLPLVAFVYFLLNRRVSAAAGKVWLVAASLFFYGWWSLSYLWLIGGSILSNYALARWLEQLNGDKARFILIIAIAGNLGLLGYYKYTDFFIGNINLFIDAPILLTHIALPLGISFFTIQQIAYLVDVYEDVVVEKSLLDYTLFVTFFPHLLAGPITHHKEMMPQFSSKENASIDWKNIYLGLFILGIGLLKKIAIAEPLSFASNEGFNNSTEILFNDAWIASLSYSMQIYFDFSGYSDMAIGAALLFNVRLPENFNSPFKAKNLQDYWKRWHITLTRFITSYIYTPLVRYTPWPINFTKSMAATFFAMCAAGLWHGASWHYVLFGVMHGAGLVISHTWHRFKLKMPNWLAWSITFMFVNAALVIFRADDMTIAINVLKGMAGLNGFTPIDTSISLTSGIIDINSWNPLQEIIYYPSRKIIILFIAITIAFFANNTAYICNKDFITIPKRSSYIVVGSTIGAAIFYMLFMASSTKSFIYFFF